MTDCGCDKARESMEDYLHGETDESTSGDVAEHLACCEPCEQEWKVGYSLTVSVKRACCEEAPEELKANIVKSIKAHGST